MLKSIVYCVTTRGMRDVVGWCRFHKSQAEKRHAAASEGTEPALSTSDGKREVLLKEPEVQRLNLQVTAENASVPGMETPETELASLNTGGAVVGSDGGTGAGDIKEESGAAMFKQCAADAQHHGRTVHVSQDRGLKTSEQTIITDARGELILDGKFVESGRAALKVFFFVCMCWVVGGFKSAASFS